MSDLEIREFEVRLADGDEDRTVTGIAVPWDDEINIYGYRERFAKGAVKHTDNTLLMYGHSEPIGRITAYRDTNEGHEITAKISATTRGDEVYTLLRDGVLTKFSVGFRPVADRDDDGVIVREEVDLREVSIVPIPAYDKANIANVRSETSAAETQEERTVMTDTVPAAEVVELRGELEEFRREIQDALEREPEEPAIDTRSAGAILQALARGDEDTVRRYNDMMERAYTGGTTADTITHDAWVGDLTRLVDEASTLRSLFSTGTLPAKGMSIEFGVLDANTTQVTEQANEGDDLAYGKVSVTNDTAPVKTFGGYTQLTRQEIERSSIAILDHNMRALGLAAGKRRNSSFLSHYNTEAAAQVTAENVVEIPATPDYVDYVGAIIDGAEIYESLGLALDAYVVSKDEFKTLAGLTATDGRPLMTVSGTGANVVGTLNPKAITGNLAGVPVVYAPGVTVSAFVNRLAIRDYTSPIVRLQDDNIINLSRDFSLYFYSALASEIPAGIVPVVEASA